jgi:hypothetical protein
VRKICDFRSIDLDPFDGTCCSSNIAKFGEFMVKCRVCGTLWSRGAGCWRRQEFRYCDRTDECDEDILPVVRSWPKACRSCPMAIVSKYPQQVA